MSEAGSSPSPNVTALVDALDARARQAGSDGAATLVRGMLGTLSESLLTLEQRLDAIEKALTADRDQSLATSVQSNLSVLNSRLGRLEEAFVQAVDDSTSGTQVMIDQIREAVVAHLSPASAVDPHAVAAPIIEALEKRLGALEAAVTSRPVAAERLETDVLSAVSEVFESTFAMRMGDALSPVLVRLGQLDERIARAVDAQSPEQASAAALDPDLVARLDAAVEAMQRDETRAQIVALVEERMTAVVRAVDERLRRADEVDARPAVRAVEEQIEALRNDDRVIEALRREAELLTQRVAALAVGVEATRAMCEQLAATAEQSLGRRAGEVGRRFAKDLGLMPRRPSSGRGERELGPGR